MPLLVCKSRLLDSDIIRTWYVKPFGSYPDQCSRGRLDVVHDVGSEKGSWAKKFV